MRMEKQIISELNRMREIMGLSLLLEIRLPAWVKNYLLDVLGYTEKQIDNIEKSADDFSDLSKLSDEFASMGVKSFDDLKSVVARDMRLGRVSDVSDEVILKWMKESPEIIQSVTSKLNKLAASQADSLIKKAEWQSIVGDDLAKTYEDFLNLKSIDGDDIILDAENASSVEIIANTYKSQIDNEIARAESAGTPVPDSLRDLSREMGELSQQAKNLDELNRRDLSGVSGSRTGNTPLTPNPSRLSDEELTQQQLKLELEKTYDKIVADGNVPTKNFPKKPSDEFYKIALEKFGKMSDDEIKILHEWLVENFSRDPATFKNQWELFRTKYSLPIAMGKVVYEFILQVPGKALTFFKNHWGKMAGLFILITLGVIGREKYLDYEAGALTKGDKLYCFRKNVSTFSQLSLEDQQGISDATGTTCEDFDGNDLTKIIQSVVEKESPNTGLMNFVVTYKDGTIKTFNENYKLTKTETPNPTQTPSTTTYTNDPTGYKKYVKDKGGTYGTNGNYVMEDGKPYYKDSNGNWQEGKYDATTKTFVTN